MILNLCDNDPSHAHLGGERVTFDSFLPERRCLNICLDHDLYIFTYTKFSMASSTLLSHGEEWFRIGRLQESVGTSNIYAFVYLSRKAV